MKTFLKQKRNLAALIVWCCMFVALMGGLIYIVIAYQNGSMIKSDFSHRLLFVFSCLACMTAVYLVELLFRIRLPLFLELACSIFPFVGLAGGTVFGLYGVMPWYDKFLHTTSGFLFSIMGLSLASLLLKNQPEGKRNVLAACAIAFFFSLTVGYIWELYEFSLDTVFGMNNQRWISGEFPIETAEGTFIVANKRGTAIVDTMGDMLVNFIGTLVFLVPTLVVCLKKPSRVKVFETEVCKRKKPAQTEPAPQSEEQSHSDEPKE